VIGAWRGLVREVVSILGWIIAFLAANLFAGPLGPSMPEAIPSPELRVAAAFVAVFIVSLILASLAGLILSKVLKAVGLGGFDRWLGALFGAARGVLILAGAGLLAGLTSGPKQPVWRDSVSGPLLAQAAGALKPFLPQTLAERMRYD